MSHQSRPHYHIAPLAGFEPSIGRALWQLEDTRSRLGHVLDGISPEIIDWQPSMGNSIGTLLYHIAIIEMDWLYNEVLEKQLPESVWDNFPYPVRGQDGHLMPVTGVSLDTHYKRLDSTRKLLLNTYQQMSLEDYRRPRAVEQYDVTPEWVLYHLLEHEIMHRGEMVTVRTFAEANRK